MNLINFVLTLVEFLSLNKEFLVLLIFLISQTDGKIFYKVIKIVLMVLCCVVSLELVKEYKDFVKMSQIFKEIDSLPQSESSSVPNIIFLNKTSDSSFWLYCGLAVLSILLIYTFRNNYSPKDGPSEAIRGIQENLSTLQESIENTPTDVEPSLHSIAQNTNILSTQQEQTLQELVCTKEELEKIAFSFQDTNQGLLSLNERADRLITGFLPVELGIMSGSFFAATGQNFGVDNQNRVIRTDIQSLISDIRQKYGIDPDTSSPVDENLDTVFDFVYRILVCLSLLDEGLCTYLIQLIRDFDRDCHSLESLLSFLLGVIRFLYNRITNNT
jgi:hypothetical protein